ncbi:hypothetical protein [Pararhizobium qamdonense]|uniref:hypothetical protein n=1 Tax=Pararhizobium qamdonense TaxID=3031126 RepID=UPI0023E14741|nr:hypothetical protein [Pararhizobium qamdonense]
MSATVLQFVPRPKPEAKPVEAAPAIDVSQAECRLLDATRAVTDRILDVVNTDTRIIRDFLACKGIVGATFKHLGREYHLRVSLEDANDGPRIA